MNETPLPGLFELTPLNPAYRTDPYAVLEDLRQRCPVHWDERAGSFILTRYEDARPLLSDRTLWRDPQKADASSMVARFAEPVPDGGPRSESTSILRLDDPDHQRIRAPLTQALYARVAKIRPQVEQIVDAALDELRGEQTFDLMVRFCVPVPVDAIAMILGVDRERLGDFREWSEGVIQSLNPFRTPEQTERMERASEALASYFSQTFHARRASPRDDLITDMTRLQAEGAPLSDIELQINLAALLIGGNLTTTDLIGNGARLFLLNPGELAKLKAQPDLIGGAVEEILRYEPPVDFTARVASHELEIGGCPARAGQSLSFSLRGANRDPSVFSDPDRFDITREHKPHMAFGGGAHICIGAPLARLEAQVALPRLFERFPDLHLANPDEPPVWRSLPFFRGLERLEVTA